MRRLDFKTGLAVYALVATLLSACGAILKIGWLQFVGAVLLVPCVLMLAAGILILAADAVIAARRRRNRCGGNDT